MMRDQWHHGNVPFTGQPAQWLRVMAEESKTAQPLELVDRCSPRSSQTLSEVQLAQAIDECLREAVKTEAIDVDALVERAKQEQRVANRWMWAGRVTAFAAMAGALVVGVVYFLDPTITHQSEDAPRLVNLEDGSRMELNAYSSVQVHLSSTARELSLTRGEGLFRVRPDPQRPFRVHAGNTIFEAVGTQFDVRLFEDHTTLAVVEGVVQLKSVSSDAGKEEAANIEDLPRVTAGFSVSVDREGRVSESQPVDVVATTAWRRVLALVFTNVSLADIAEAFNDRNAKPRLIIEGDALRERRFAISFDTANSQELVDYLKKDEGLMFISTSDEVIVRERNP